MDQGVLIVAAIAVAGIVVLARFFGGVRRPKRQSFRCARSSTGAMHTARTIEAWRRGKTEFFCNSCHGERLRSLPQDAAPARGGRSGCLSAVVLFIVVPSIAVVSYFSR